MSALIVRSPGLFSSVQDRGRFRFGKIGVPSSGALDQVALRLANALVGNDDNAAVLEVLGLGPTLEAGDDPVRVALVGDAPDMIVVGSDGAKRPVASGRSLRLEPGEQIVVGNLASFCACLAVEGGIDVPVVLGSRSTYVRGGFGGLSGRILKVGDRLAVAAASDQPVEKRLAGDLDIDPDAPIRVVPGPQADRFTPAGFAAFLGGEYRVTNSADRMGFRLEGPEIDHVRGPDIVSDGAVTGSIQVPGSKQPIVLLADGQSVGGYTKIATIISADLSRFARKKPGAPVRFAAVTQAQGEEAARVHDATLRETIATFADAHDGLDLEALYAANLVSGVTDAR